MEKILGKAIGLPLVTHIGTFRTHSARSTQTWHSHQGFELLFVMSGATSWDFQRGREIEVAGGHFLIVPPGAVHRGAHAIRKPSSICGLLFDPKCRAGWKNSNFTKQDLRGIHSRFKNSPLTVHAFDQELMSRVNRLIEMKRAFELDPRNAILKASLRMLACSVILETARGLIAPPRAAPGMVVAAVADYFKQHLGESVRMPALVRHIGFGRSRLFAIFKSGTGMTPNDYLVRIRVEKAQQLLSHSTCSITDIALETGFSTSQYFSTVFRKHTGLTPKDFRREESKKQSSAASGRTGVCSTASPNIAH